MRRQFQNLTRAALAGAWMLTGDPIDGTRALLNRVHPVEPAAMSVGYEVTAERALLARFDWSGDRQESSLLSIAELTPERALLGR